MLHAIEDAPVEQPFLLDDPTQFLLTASCILLFSWYGVRRTGVFQGAAEEEMPSMKPGSRIAARALAAEFRDRLDEASHLPGGVVVCTACGTEYPAGVLYCDCGAATAEVEENEGCEAGRQPAREQAGADASEDELVCIHVADTYWKASLIKSYLENHSIACAIGGNPVSQFPMPISPLGEHRLLVLRHQCREARLLLRRLASNG